MHRTIAAVMVAASLANVAGAQTAPPPGVPAATTSSQATPVFSLDAALGAAGMPSTASAPSFASGASNGSTAGFGASARTALPSVGAATANVEAATAARRVPGLRPNPEVQAQVENPRDLVHPPRAVNRVASPMRIAPATPPPPINTGNDPA